MTGELLTLELIELKIFEHFMLLQNLEEIKVNDLAKIKFKSGPIWYDLQNSTFFISIDLYGCIISLRHVEYELPGHTGTNNWDAALPVSIWSPLRSIVIRHTPICRMICVVWYGLHHLEKWSFLKSWTYPELGWNWNGKPEIKLKSFLK